jgi:hypothetical protein
MTLNLLVIRTKAPELLKSQYELLGLSFKHHKHGNGPYHYACELNTLVFEIYPLTKSMIKADYSTRLGFSVKNVFETINNIENSSWVIQSNPTNTEWGLTASIKDLDGRTVELKNE